MEYPWTTHGLPIGNHWNVWATHGTMGATHGLPIGNYWKLMGCPWATHELLMDYSLATIGP